MPRKRKVNAEAAGGDASSSKKPCHDGSGETTIDSCSVRWEWEGDKNVWTQYAGNLNESICKAVANGLNEVDFDVGKTSLAVKIDQMAQKNKKTGWQRRLRCCVQEDGGFYVWQWEDEQGKWNPYSYDIAVKLEKARQLKETEVDVSACARSYRVDLSKMHQTNLVTDVVRNVARIKSGKHTNLVTDVVRNVARTKSGKHTNFVTDVVRNVTRIKSGKHTNLVTDVVRNVARIKSGKHTNFVTDVVRNVTRIKSGKQTNLVKDVVKNMARIKSGKKHSGIPG